MAEANDNSVATSILNEKDSWKGWKCEDLTPDLCPLSVEKGQLQVRGVNVTYWRYKRSINEGTISDQEETRSSRFPIITLHGGPAWPHNYLLPLKQQACRGREIIFYDQGGCGESKIPKSSKYNRSSLSAVKENFPWLLKPSYYSQEELPALISHLGLDKYHIIGNSWGTILAQMFALDYYPTTLSSAGSGNMVSMVLSGPLSDMKSYIKAQWDENDGSLGSLPPYVQERIKNLEKAQAYNSAEYRAISAVLTGFFTCRTEPAPDCFMESENGMNAAIYVGMQGASEFTISGVLTTFNVTGRLHELTKLPVLLTAGKFDTMRPTEVDTMYRSLPLAEKVLFAKSGHVSMIDEPGAMNDAIAEFLDRVEAADRTGQQFVPVSAGDIHSLPTNSFGKSFFDNENLNFFLGTMIAFILGGLIGTLSSKYRRRNTQYESLPSS